MMYVTMIHLDLKNNGLIACDYLYQVVKFYEDLSQKCDL